MCYELIVVPYCLTGLSDKYGHHSAPWDIVLPSGTNSSLQHHEAKVNHTSELSSAKPAGIQKKTSSGARPKTKHIRSMSDYSLADLHRRNDMNENKEAVQDGGDTSSLPLTQAHKGKSGSFQ